MKALIIWNSYGSSLKVGTVEKMTLEQAKEEGYKQPELIYEITNTVINCDSNEIDYKSILGKDFNYLSDNIGFTWYQESYVCSITEDQYKSLINLYEKSKEDKNKLQKEIDQELKQMLNEDEELTKKMNMNFKLKEFTIFINGKQNKLEVTGFENCNNSVKVRLNNSEDVGILEYSFNKVFLNFKNRDKRIDITNCQKLIDFLWSAFEYRGCDVLYRYTSNYKINYLD
ncbi:hypothetical protein HYI16_17180 [Clostridium botulinum]|uniref:hypothetical protein n=1 Tax=Clostridium botulinum TaxID=1491 RepID=UPI001C9ABE28|nr:hypothetical protein [Clostridium botulinum]MBY7043774.1 hypothetical protein [Clostridium botulinum]